MPTRTTPLHNIVLLCQATSQVPSKSNRTKPAPNAVFPRRLRLESTHLTTGRNRGYFPRPTGGPHAGPTTGAVTICWGFQQVSWHPYLPQGTIPRLVPAAVWSPRPIRPSLALVVRWVLSNRNRNRAGGHFLKLVASAAKVFNVEHNAFKLELELEHKLY